MKLELIETLKNTIPESAKPFLRSLKELATDSPTDRRIKRLKRRDNSRIPLLLDTEEIIRRVQFAANAIYGENWNFQSDALRREMVQLFETCVQHLALSKQYIDYLEIGSCQGLSMSLMGQLLADARKLGTLVSIDPYFTDGYIEQDSVVEINKSTRERAFSLYKSLGVAVEHLEEISSTALTKLLRTNRSFSLIYVDGSHEGMNPLRDTALSIELVTSNGIIMLDDHQTYGDVKVVKELCDRNYRKIAETWKVAAYEIPS